MKALPCLFACLMLSGTASAQSACGAFDDSIESSLKLIAMSKTEGLLDNSAPRATLRQLEISNELALINNNLLLMAQNKCAVRKSPINANKYIGEAITCSLARSKGEKDAPACKDANWTGNLSAEGAKAAVAPDGPPQ